VGVIDAEKRRLPGAEFGLGIRQEARIKVGVLTRRFISGNEESLYHQGVMVKLELMYNVSST
jgi:hypothetical protein